MLAFDVPLLMVSVWRSVVRPVPLNVARRAREGEARLTLAEVLRSSVPSFVRLPPTFSAWPVWAPAVLSEDAGRRDRRVGRDRESARGGVG
jgi:hypothetical protein